VEGIATVARLIGEKVKYIANRAAIGLVDLSVRAFCTGYGGESFVLNIKELCQEPSGCSKFICIESSVSTFRTIVVSVFHFSI